MQSTKQQQRKDTTKGSFLLELLIAFAVISISLTVVVDSFLSSQKSYRIIAEQTGLTRALTTVLEDMTREARVSELYACGLGVDSPCEDITLSMTRIKDLNEQDVATVVYTIDANNTITKSVDGSSEKMTPPSIEISNFRVTIVGEHTEEPVRAFVSFTANVKDSLQTVHLQTSFTERSF